jgi:hypothetical protein
MNYGSNSEIQTMTYASKSRIADNDLTQSLWDTDSDVWQTYSDSWVLFTNWDSGFSQWTSEWLLLNAELAIA